MVRSELVFSYMTEFLYFVDQDYLALFHFQQSAGFPVLLLLDRVQPQSYQRLTSSVKLWVLAEDF